MIQTSFYFASCFWSEYIQRYKEHVLERAAFRIAQSNAPQNRRFPYPAELQSLPPFSKWLRQHKISLPASGFPIPKDVVRLSCPPSPQVASYRRMMAYGAHLRCESGDTSSHITYDSGVAVMESEHVAGSINVGVLTKIYVVASGSLNAIVLKVGWVQHLHQGRCTIRKDSNGL